MSEYEVIAKAFRPGLFSTETRNVRTKPVSEKELTRRYKNGLDFWTGKPLKGPDARSWIRIKFGIEEREYWPSADLVEEIVKVEGPVVTVRLKGGMTSVLDTARRARVA